MFNKLSSLDVLTSFFEKLSYKRNIVRAAKGAHKKLSTPELKKLQRASAEESKTLAAQGANVKEPPLATSLRESRGADVREAFREDKFWRPRGRTSKTLESNEEFTRLKEIASLKGDNPSHGPMFTKSVPSVKPVKGSTLPKGQAAPPTEGQRARRVAGDTPLHGNLTKDQRRLRVERKRSKRINNPETRSSLSKEERWSRVRGEGPAQAPASTPTPKGAPKTQPSEEKTKSSMKRILAAGAAATGVGGAGYMYGKNQANTQGLYYE